MVRHWGDGKMRGARWV